MMNLKHTLIAAGVMVLGMLMLQFVNHAEDIQPNVPLSAFPSTIDEWAGQERRFDQAVYDELGVDDSYLGVYRTPDGRQAQIYIGFYQSQREGDLIHSPRNCMPGSGWNIIRSSLTPVNRMGEPAKVIRMVLQNGERKQAMLYWFQSRGRIISSEYMQKIYLVVDSITRHRTDGSFIRLLAPIVDNDEEKAFASLKEFAEKVMPVLDRHIPS